MTERSMYECGYCRSPLEGEKVLVTAGAQAGVDDGRLVMEGLHQDWPLVEHWHLECARAHGYDFDSGTVEGSINRIKPYFNTRTVASFLLGALLSLLASSMFIV